MMLDQGNAMLVWMLQPVAETEAEWNEWYDLEHVPALLEVPGFLSGNRFRLTSTAGLGRESVGFVPNYFSCYELADESVLDSEEYHARRSSLLPGMRPQWTQRMLGAITDAFGGVYVPVGQAWAADPQVLAARADELAVLTFHAPDDSLAALDAWLDEVVRLGLNAAPGVLAHRSFELLRGSPPIAGMRNRRETANRMILCSIDWQPSAGALVAEIDYPETGAAGTLARYERWL